MAAQEATDTSVSARTWWALVFERWGERVNGPGIAAFLVLVSAVVVVATKGNAVAAIVVSGVIALWCVVSIPIATYSVWKCERVARLGFEATSSSAADIHAPQFTVSVLDLQWDKDRRGRDFFLIATLGIANAGADSSVGRYTANANKRAGEAADVRVLSPTAPLTISRPDGGVVDFSPRDFLTETVASVARNGLTIGILLVEFTGTDGPEGTSAIDLASLQICIQDPLGNEWRSRLPLIVDFSGASSFSFPGLPKPRYG